ncbi:hypothetical protein CBW53_19400 [Yersinia frederiksenii]|nr:hypothetical protein CBW53_19400 [Yersinia frederiksenii]
MTIAAITKSLSTPRFATYQLPILGATSPEQCLGVYLWNKQLASAFLPALQIVEISLRNAIHQAYVASLYLDIENNHPQNTWEVKKSHAREWLITTFTEQRNYKSWKQIETAKSQLRIDNKPLTPENILPKLTFGFWVSLVSNSFDVHKATYLTLWPNLRGSVFPYALDSVTKVPLSINSIGNALLDINKIRNRLSHHEPLWRNKDAYQVEDIINAVIKKYELCLKIIGWINPSNLKLLSLIDNNRKMAELCSLHSLWLNKQLPVGLSSLPSQIDWVGQALLDTTHTGEVIRVFQNSIMIKSDKDKAIFHSDDVDFDGDITNYVIGTKVHFYPKISSRKYANAKKVSRL